MAVSNGPDDEIGLDSFYKNNIKKAKLDKLKEQQSDLKSALSAVVVIPFSIWIRYI